MALPPRLRPGPTSAARAAAVLCACLAATVLALLVPGTGRADDLTLAVATNFAEPVEELVALFETRTGHEVVTVSGSTGQLYAQIRQGAPFDILLAADQARPARLAENGLGLSNTRFTYAVGRLVLWSRDADAFGTGPAPNLDALDYRRLAIANPALAPYGLAADEALAQLGHDPGDRRVFGQNIGQVYAMAATGHADLALIARSQWLSRPVPERGSAWLVPSDLHAPIRQDVILLRRARDNPAATDFLTFMRSENARQIIAAAGYDLP